MEHDLLAAIYAAPYDDAPRAVFADWLEERRDPRGEFIHLQLAPGTSDRVGRIRRLLSAFAERWIGPLPATPRTAVFRRGFVAQVTRLAKWTDEPEWGTVERHNILPPRDSCHDHALRVVDQMHSSSFTQLALRRRPFAIEEMSWSFFTPDPQWHETAEATRVFRESGLFPALRRFRVAPYPGWREVTVDELGWLYESQTFPRLRELSLPLAPSQLGALIDRMGNLERLVVETADSLRDGLCSELRAGTQELRVVVPARRTDLSQLMDVLVDGIGRRITHVTFVVPAEAEKWFARQRVDLERTSGCELRFEVGADRQRKARDS